MTQYRKKPVIIEAVRVNQIDQEFPDTPPFDEYPEWLHEAIWDGDVIWTAKDGADLITIKTLEGTMIANNGDYIIRGVAGELYPCKPAIFEKTYDEVIKGWNDE